LSHADSPFTESSEKKRLRFLKEDWPILNLYSISRISRNAASYRGGIAPSKRPAGNHELDKGPERMATASAGVGLNNS